MKERLKKTPFYKFKERKLLKKQIDSMTNAESQAALDLAKKEEKERRKLKKLEKKVRDAVLKLKFNFNKFHAGGPQQEDDRRRDARITQAASPHPTLKSGHPKKSADPHVATFSTCGGRAALDG